MPDANAQPNAGAVVSAPAPGTPEYDAAMIALADRRATMTVVGADGMPETLAKEPGTAAAEGAVPQRPDNVPEKFWDPVKGEVRMEALLKAHSELESARGKTPPAAKTADEANPGQAAEAAQNAVQQAGLDWNQLSDYYATAGALSDEHYTKLAAVGFPRAVVDSFIAGQEALAGQLVNQAVEITQGPENYAAMTAWAAANLDAATIEQYNSLVTGTKAQMSLAVQGMWARYVAANGQPPAHTEGGGSNSVVGDVFRSNKELANAIRDPRFESDPTYRALVEAKAARSNF